MKTLLILGATGQVGGALLSQSLSHVEVARVVAPTRKPLVPRAKLFNPVIDFEALPSEAPWWRADACLSALGSTLKLAGSPEAFHHIDHDLVLAAARCAHRAGAPAFVNNSSLGADAGARGLYLRTKGELELALQALGFVSLCQVRPSLLDGGPRSDQRLGEQAALFLARRLAGLIPKRYQAVSVEAVGAVMLDAALRAVPGVSVIESDQVQALAAARFKG